MEKETVSLQELSNTFGVSLNTIRRDINYLEESGVLKKVYGGVTSMHGKQLTSFDFRNTKNSDFKEIIGKLASSYIEDGDFIFIDSGTTTANILPHVNKNIHFTILTNNFDVIFQATKLSNVEIIILGNRYYPKARSFITNSIAALPFDYNITKSFMAVTGVSIDNGLTNADFQELEIKKVVTEKSNNIYMLADESKFGKVSLVTYCKLEKVNKIFSNNCLPNNYEEFCKNHTIDIITPK